MTTGMKFMEWMTQQGDTDAMNNMLDHMLSEMQLNYIIKLCKWLEK